MTDGGAAPLLEGLDALLGRAEELYTDLHAHPELGLQEHRTAERAADRLAEAGFEATTGVGTTGVVGVLRNGDGPTVALRADTDALPVREDTGLSYANSVTATDHDGHEVPVAHACGHDLHVAWLATVATLLGQQRDAWSGTVVAHFRPAEEIAAGAQGMIDDGLVDRFPTPDVVLGQHVMPFRAGDVRARPGTSTSASDVWHIRLLGRGAHGSAPEAAVDPVVLAASTVLRLPTVVSRELGTSEPAVLTVGMLQAGSKENVEARLPELPTNHGPRFAPAPGPTLRTGAETLVTAAGAWLCAG